MQSFLFLDLNTLPHCSLDDRILPERERDTHRKSIIEVYIGYKLSTFLALLTTILLSGQRALQDMKKRNVLEICQSCFKKGKGESGRTMEKMNQTRALNTQYGNVTKKPPV
jgi:hypothetical protein